MRTPWNRIKTQDLYSSLPWRSRFDPDLLLTLLYHLWSLLKTGMQVVNSNSVHRGLWVNLVNFDLLPWILPFSSSWSRSEVCRWAWRVQQYTTDKTRSVATTKTRVTSANMGASLYSFVLDVVELANESSKESLSCRSLSLCVRFIIQNLGTCESSETFRQVRRGWNQFGCADLWPKSDPSLSKSGDSKEKFGDVSQVTAWKYLEHFWPCWTFYVDIKKETANPIFSCRQGWWERPK